MRGRKVGAVLLLAVAVLTTACSDSDAYPNDQNAIEHALADAGLEAVSVTGSESFDPDGWNSYVTVSYTTTEAVPSKTVLTTVRRVVWERYPHRLKRLYVDVTAAKGKWLPHDYTREDMEAEFGKQEFREDDSEDVQEDESEPPSSIGTFAAFVAAGIAVIWFITFVHTRFLRRGSWPTLPEPPAVRPASRTGTKRIQTGARTPSPPAPTTAPGPNRPAKLVPETSPSYAGTPASTPTVPRESLVQPATVKREPVRPSQRRNFEETQVALNDGWQYLDALVPDPPRKGRAEFVDNWLAEHSGVPVEKITKARRARNVAIHRPDKIDKATMNEAIEVIDTVAEKLPHQPG